MKINRDYSRGFLSAASAYRRHGKGYSGDFSADAMREQYEHETLGHGVSSGNGFAFGKRSLDVTMKAMRQDFGEGLFCKAELMDGSCAFVRKEIHKWTPKEWFPWRGAC